MFKLALPKGHLLNATDRWLKRAGLGAIDYNEGSRNYRPRCSDFPELFFKVFHEKDIPIQVAIGNYDLGVCGLDWVEELLTKYPSSSLIKLRPLGYGKHQLYLATSRLAGIGSLAELNRRDGVIRLASEYPNLAESFALGQRWRQFRIFPLWGAAGAYPPEQADLIVISSANLDESELILLRSLLQSSAVLIANQHSWETKDMSILLSPLYNAVPQEVEALPLGFSPGEEPPTIAKPTPPPSETLLIRGPQKVARLFGVNLALPDGHQQTPCLEFLDQAGVKILSSHPRHPSIDFPDVSVKVIRPQDMPAQVALGNFDLAITGRDWLYDHLYRFPSSPVKEILDLGFGKVKIVAVVSENLGVNNIRELREFFSSLDTLPSPDNMSAIGLPRLRIASEYINIADKYARDHHLSPYRLIPTWGASEAFLPEDADLLIENTQTGKTLAQHHLEIIDTLFESSACLIGNLASLNDKVKGEKINQFAERLSRGKSF
jgi:ATP phosphoribosyltransferase